jgi:plastocyanin
MRAWCWVAVAAFMILGSGARAEDMTIEIENFTFTPAELTIKPGTKVTWKNADDIPHSVVEDATKFRSKALDTGETFSMVFTEPGEIGYFCGLHPHMKGKIIVKP